MALPTTTREYQLTKIGSYDNLQLKEKPVSPPKAYQVLVKVHAVSLQYRDLVVANGKYGVSLPDQLVPCSDMAGEIIALGEGVTDWKVGDRVCANFALDHLHGDSNAKIRQTSMGGQSHGVLTQYRTFPAHSLVKCPDHFSYEEASTLPCAALTAYNALNGPLPVKAGDYVLALGTGGVSICALQFAVASGAIAIVTSSSDEKLKIATKLGAKHVINYKKTPDWDKVVLEITGGVGVDHIIEVGGDGTLPKSLNAVRSAGYLHIIGFVAGSNNDTSIVRQTIGKAINIRGIQIGSVTQFKAMNRLITANPEKTKPVIDKVFTFKEAIEAYKYLDSQQHVGKVVIKVA